MCLDLSVRQGHTVLPECQCVLIYLSDCASPSICLPVILAVVMRFLVLCQLRFCTASSSSYLPSIPGPNAASYVPFDPVMYLVSAHKSAFNAVMLLWNKKPLPVYGPRMSESILSIMCHILKGETTIRVID